MTKPSPSKVKATSGIAWKGVERFDEGALRKIIANLPQVLGKKEDDLAVRNMQWQLMRYLKGSVNGTREVEYVFAAGVPDGVGRIFPKYGVGMSIVKGVIRDSCCKDMIEMDIVNAHPTLLVQYAEKHGLPANLLQGYVERRDEYLGDLMRTFRCDRKAAKDTMLKYLNSKRAVNSGPAWLAPLALQLQDLQDAVTALNPTIREVKLHKWYNMQGSVMNLVLCTIERECIFSCKKFLKAAGVEVMMSQHDGCGCANDPQRPFTPEFLEELSLHVAQETGYTLKFAIKPMDKAIDVAALPKTELPLFLNPVHAVSKPTPLGLAGLSEAPEDPEFRVQAFPTTHPHVVVWARMGGGKTFRAREYAKSLGVESALFVTPRQVFSYSIQDGFLPVFPDLRHYKDTEGDPYQAPYLVVQLESLFKVKPEGYDLVILDECESVLSQMKSDTNTEFEQVYAMFEHILRSAKYSLWMDAFLSDRTLTTLKLLLPPKDICVVHNTYVDRVRRAVMLEVPPPPKRKKGEKPKKKKLSPRKKVLLKCFLDLARQNKRVVCMVGSVSFAQQLKEALKEAHPDQRVLVITRNASDKIKKANVEELWVKYDHIIYTSTVTVGTSFDPEIPHFHCALAYFSANSIRPRDMLQGLQRAKEAGVDLDDAFKEYQKNTATMENTKKNMKMELYRELDVSALLSDRARHAEVIEELCALLGVKHSLDIDHKIDANTVVRVGQHVRANSKKIWDIFGVGYSINSKHSPERQASDVLNAIFNRWGLTRLVKTERRQKRAPNGKLMEAPGVYQLRFQAKWMEYLRCARIDTIRYARARGQIIGDEDGPGVLLRGFD